MGVREAVIIAKAAIQQAVGQKPAVVLEYEKLWATAQLRPEFQRVIDIVVARHLVGRERYERVSAALGGRMPWYHIMNWHMMEAGAKQNPFAFHLHCGDPLTGRTINIPRGRPKHNPSHGSSGPSRTNPYTWEESAIDCLQNVMGFHKVTDWSIGNALWLSERFNGLGYRRRKINTPYVWSYTNHYGTAPHIGKFVADGKFDPRVISKQAGCAAYLLQLINRGTVTRGQINIGA